MIDEFQSSLGILYTDARPATVLVVLGVIGVVTDKSQLSLVRSQRNIDLRLAPAAHTMLEGILDERNEEQGGDGELRVES